MISGSEFDVFDRNPGSALDELTELAAAMSRANYAYIGWMDSHHLWFKSRWGFSATDQTRTETACRWVAETGQPLLIGDAAQDGRFPSEGIQVPGGRPCRSYLGVPLLTADRRIAGTLAVLAANPSQFTREHLRYLEILGQQVMARVELQRLGRARPQGQGERPIERSHTTELELVAHALDSIAAAVAVLDTAGRVVRLNEPCALLTGWSTAEAAGQLFLNRVLQDDDLRWVSTKLREAVEGRVSGPHEDAWRTADGPLRRVRWTLSPLKAPDGLIRNLVVSGQDITEQREIEKSLLKTESRFRHVVESSLGLMFTCTMEGLLMSLNAFTEETLGHRAEDLIGRSLAEFMNPADIGSLRDCLQSLERDQEWQGAFTFRRSDGVCKRFALRSCRMELRGERPFIVSHGADVSQQYETELAARRATSQDKLILQAVDDGVFGIDQEGRLTFINEAGARTLGSEPEQLKGRGIYEIFNRTQSEEKEAGGIADVVMQAVRRGEPAPKREGVIRRANGSAIPVEFNASPLIEDGQVQGMIVAFRDTSERRRMDKMKDEIISTVSHELRTPLTSMRASLMLVSSGSLAERPEKQRQMLMMAIDNCDRLVRLVSNIVDFEKSQVKRLAMHPAPVEAVDLLRRGAETALPIASQVDIVLRIEAQTALVMADEDRILQVLHELISNAIKFSPPNTVIRLGALPTDDQTVCFLVEDQGPGIPPNKLDRIFEHFEQGDASDSRSQGGTGMGLAVCRGIIELHGGDIWAENLTGRGSRFLFTLPRTSRKNQ